MGWPVEHRVQVPPGASIETGDAFITIASRKKLNEGCRRREVRESKKEALRIRFSRAMGWPVEHRVRIPAGASVETNEALITIATSGEVVVEVAIDEDGFVRRLESLTGGERRRAAEAFAARR